MKGWSRLTHDVKVGQNSQHFFRFAPYHICPMSPDSTLIHLVNSYDSGEITRSEFQKRVRALPPGLILRVAEILTETSNCPSRRQPMVESVVESRQIRMIRLRRTARSAMRAIAFLLAQYRICSSVRLD